MGIWSDIEKPHATLKTERQREEPKWRDLQRLMDEDGENLDPRTKGNDEQDTFDSTPLYAKDDFVGGLFTDAVNPAEPWFAYGLEDKDLQKWGPVAQWLWNYRNVVVSSLDPSVSNFYVQCSPWFGDLAMIGNGFMWQEENVGRNRLIERCLPFREMYRSVDAAGETNRLHREFKLNGIQAKGWFGDRAPPMPDDQDAIFVHAMYENPEFRPGALGPKGKPWVSCYASPDKRDFNVETAGFFELPVHEIQWQTRSGRSWAIGPGHKALPDMRGLDEKSRAGLVALQFMAEPMLLAHDESVITAADIFPSNIIAGGMSDQGKRVVEHLERGDNMQYPLADIERTRAAIREAFYFSLFQLVNRPQMTAAEFNGWSAEKLRILAPRLVTLHKGLGTFLARRSGILGRAGRVPPPPPELQGQRVTVEFTSPFAQAQKANKARNALQIGTSALALQPLFPEIADNYDGDEIARALADGASGDPRLVRDPRVVAQIRQGRAQQLEQQQKMQQAEQVAGIVADMSHAQQASTLAGGRGRPQ
jgi:hypothetical protein